MRSELRTVPEGPDPDNPFLDEYMAALRAYWTGCGEASLERAVQLGRDAAATGRGVLEIAAVHHRAMIQMLLSVFSMDQPLEKDVEAVGKFCASCPSWYASGIATREHQSLEMFFAASLAVFVASHRGLQRANVALRRVDEMREQEVRRIASALHDGAGQLLVSVHIALAQLASELPLSQGVRLDELRRLLDETEVELRRLSHELRPPLLDDLGLVAALDYLVEGFTKRTGIRVTVESSLPARLPLLTETALYRAVSEALTNVRKHAQATFVRIRLRSTARGTACLIQDNGMGFVRGHTVGQRGDHGLGLVTVRERLAALNGRLRIFSRPGRGAVLAATIPCESAGAPAQCS